MNQRKCTEPPPATAAFSWRPAGAPAHGGASWRSVLPSLASPATKLFLLDRRMAAGTNVRSTIVLFGVS